MREVVISSVISKHDLERLLEKSPTYYNVSQEYRIMAALDVSTNSRRSSAYGEVRVWVIWETYEEIEQDLGGVIEGDGEEWYLLSECGLWLHANEHQDTWTVAKE